MINRLKNRQSRRASISAKRASPHTAIGSCFTSTSRSLDTSMRSSCARFVVQSSTPTFFYPNTSDDCTKEQVRIFRMCSGSLTPDISLQMKLSHVHRVQKYLPPNPTWTRISRKFITAITRSMFVKHAATPSPVHRISSSTSKRFMKSR